MDRLDGDDEGSRIDQMPGELAGTGAQVDDGLAGPDSEITEQPVERGGRKVRPSAHIGVRAAGETRGVPTQHGSPRAPGR